MSDPLRSPSRGSIPSGMKLGDADTPPPKSPRKDTVRHSQKLPAQDVHAREARNSASSARSVAPRSTRSSQTESEREFVHQLVTEGATERQAQALFDGGIHDVTEGITALALNKTQLKAYLAVRPAILAMDAIPVFLRVKSFLDIAKVYREAGIPLNLKTFPAYGGGAPGSKRLGEGTFNTVSKVRATELQGGEEVDMAFKPAGGDVGLAGELSGIPDNGAQLECRNVLTSLVAEKLLPAPEDNCIARSRLGIWDGEVGVMMEIARGPALNSGQRQGTLNPATGTHRQLQYGLRKIMPGEDKSQPSKTQQRLGYRDRKKESGSEKKSAFLKQHSLHYVGPSGTSGLWEADLAVKALPQGLDLEHPELKRKLTWLALIDDLCNQGDRHAGNILIVPLYNDKNELVGYHVVGIDNDQTFGHKLNDPEARRHELGRDAAPWALHRPQLIDQEMYDRITALTPQDCREMAQDLLFDPREIEAFVTRLKGLQAHLENLKAEGKVIARHDWDRAALDDPETSYVARENQKPSSAALMQDTPLTKLMLKYPVLHGIGQAGKAQTHRRTDLKQYRIDLESGALRTGGLAEFEAFLRALKAVYESREYVDFQKKLSGMARETVDPADQAGRRHRKAAKEALERLQALQKNFEAKWDEYDASPESGDAQELALQEAVRTSGTLWVLEIFRAANLQSRRAMLRGEFKIKAERLPAPPARAAKPVSPLPPPPSGMPKPVQRKAAPFDEVHPFATWINAKWPQGIGYYEITYSQLDEVCRSKESGDLALAVQNLNTRAAQLALRQLLDATIRSHASVRRVDSPDEKVGNDSESVEATRILFEAFGAALAALNTVPAHS